MFVVVVVVVKSGKYMKAVVLHSYYLCFICDWLPLLFFLNMDMFPMDSLSHRSILRMNKHPPFRLAWRVSRSLNVVAFLLRLLFSPPCTSMLALQIVIPFPYFALMAEILLRSTASPSCSRLTESMALKKVTRQISMDSVGLL